jgi:uncharacterized protein YjbJ (UPF0337 family)
VEARTLRARLIVRAPAPHKTFHIVARLTLVLNLWSIPMDRDRVEGAAKTAGGKMKETAGKVLGDQKMEAEGQMKKNEGKIQNAIGGAKDAMRDATKQ